MAVSSFVRVCIPFWKSFVIFFGIGDVLQTYGFCSCRIKTDIPADDFAGTGCTGIKNKSLFDIAEGDGSVCMDSGSHDLTTVSMDTGGGIYSNNFAAVFGCTVDGGDPVLISACHRTVKADTKDGIDDYIICVKVRVIADRD